MAMVVRSNIMALNANRQLASNNSQVSKSLEKLSSGFKINRAGDDASGLAISEKMKAQIKGLEQASANAQDGISLVQTAEGAMTEVHSMLNRMTELATKSSNGTISDEVDREAIQNEVNQLVEEIDRIGDSTNFNGINLLDGSLGKSGGTSGAKGSASVAADALLKGTLGDIAATKGTSKTAAAMIKGTIDAGADGKGVYNYEFTYADASGKATTLKIALTQLADKSLSATVNGQKVEGLTLTATAADDAFEITEQSVALKAVLEKTDMANVFDITATDTNTTLTFTAKTAGSSHGKIIAFNTAAADGTVNATPNTLVQSKGVDQFHRLTTINGAGTAGASTIYDGTDATKGNIFTVNGKKFALIQKGTDASSLAPDIIGVEVATKDTVVAADVTKLVAKINETFGAGTATNEQVAGTATLLIDFKAVEGKATAGGQGLTLQIGDTNDAFNKVTVSVDDVRSAGLGVKGLDVSTQKAAGDAIKTIKTAINKVSTNRGNLGALQNRLEYAINNLDVTAENMTAANSRIRDTDMAKEMMNYTKMNVLTQSAQAMLAQANQQPQSILQLLQ